MYDLIILGGGPAGLTAMVYALRKRLEVLLITRNLGGKTNYRLQLPDVEHHLVINGEEIVGRFVNEVEYLDFARKMERAESVERAPGGYLVRTREGGEYTARSLILATGANARWLEVPGEKEYMMRGLCYSAVSYAPLFIGRDTVVIGDGNLALRAAAELAQIARQVTLVAPAHGELGGSLGQRLSSLPNVLILEGFNVERVEGDQYARSLVVKREGEEPRTLRASAFFVELGLTPNSRLVQGLVALDAAGRIQVDARNRTSAPGIFAAGDVTNVYAEQVLIAVGEGAKAALSAYDYLLEQPAQEPVMAGEWR
jgi:thioredoxin reductase